MKREYPAEAVELWTQGAARFGLKPVTRRVWAPKGERLTAHARPTYEWQWLFAAVNSASGSVFWLVLPYLNAELMQRFFDGSGAMNQFAILFDGRVPTGGLSSNSLTQTA